MVFKKTSCQKLIMHPYSNAKKLDRFKTTINNITCIIMMLNTILSVLYLDEKMNTLLRKA